MTNHPNRAKWLKGNGGTHFLQFARARITRSSFPLGGYLYTTTGTPNEEQLYSGSDYKAAYDAACAANPDRN